MLQIYAPKVCCHQDRWLLVHSHQNKKQLAFHPWQALKPRHFQLCDKNLEL